ncbi:MAG: 2Fe-2S iron-sulfur cluster-binding protein [Gemmataceae bacterium]
MPKVTFVNEKTDVEVDAGANLRKSALSNGVQVYDGPTRWFNCMGHGTCGTCMVLVKEGKENLSPKTLIEKMSFMLSLAVVGHEEEARLSCQTRVLGDCKVQTTGFNWTGENFWQKPYPNK